MIRGNDDDLFNIFILLIDRTLPLNSVAIGYTGAGYKPLVALSATCATKLARAHAPPPPRVARVAQPMRMSLNALYFSP